jgi:hypothetical protein
VVLRVTNGIGVLQETDGIFNCGFDFLHRGQNACSLDSQKAARRFNVDAHLSGKYVAPGPQRGAFTRRAGPAPDSLLQQCNGT